VDRRCTFLVFVYKPFKNLDSLYCSVKAVPPVSMRKELHSLWERTQSRS